MAEPVAVRVRDCECPGHAHNGTGDVVYLRATLPLAGGLAAERDNAEALAETVVSVDPRPEEGYPQETLDRLAVEMNYKLRTKWATTYIRYGALGWNLVDAAGDPVPFDPEVLIEDYGLSQLVAEKGDELYGETVARPLLARQAARLQPGLTDPSTSPRKTSTTKRRRPSSRGTTAGTRRSRG